MKKRYIVLLVGGFSLVGFATPSVMLTLLKQQAGIDPSPPVESLEERRIKFNNGHSGQVKINYLEETKEAITRQLKEKGKTEFEVSEIVFTSERTKWVAGQKQVHLSFTYQVKYPRGKPQKQKASLLLATDGAGNVFSVL